MKKTLLAVLILAFFCGGAFGAAERYIIFFAESADLPKAVAEKMLVSKRFCLVMPFNHQESLKPEIEELVSLGKIEPSLSLEPEPVLPLLASVYSVGAKGQKGFSDYISGNFNAFENYANRLSFGMFLKSAWVSHNIMYYFAAQKLSWINVDNAAEKIHGAYLIDGVASFFPHKNFPLAQKDVMKWLEARKETFIPVLLTKKHLSNDEFMAYIIELFDRRGNQVKLLEILELREVQGRLSAIVTRMTTLAAGTSTSLNVTNLRYDEQIPEGVFTTNYLETGRP